MDHRPVGATPAMTIILRLVQNPISFDIGPSSAVFP
jgi:hypothetical protein